MKEICDSCQTCHKFISSPLQAIVELPLGNNVNDTDCLDLKQYIPNQLCILYLAYTNARYFAARLIKIQKIEEIIKNIFLMWIYCFRIACYFLNGRQMNKKLNTEIVLLQQKDPLVMIS